MDEYDILYLDDDERNASNRDHRVQAGKNGRAVAVRRRAVLVPARRRVAMQATGDAGPRREPVVIQEAPAPTSRLAGLSTGELIEIAAGILAAIQPLPAPPTAVGSVETDVENLVVYQTALATHAKRDEQLRTLGMLLGRLLK